MRIVADSNILFAFFWKDSAFTKLCQKNELKLISPEYALEEINNYKEEIMKKAKISEVEFENRKIELVKKVDFLPLKDYVSEFNNVKKLAEMCKEEYDEILKDIDFLALAMKLDIPLWTHDKLLKKQEKIKIITTKDVIEVL